MAFESWTKTEFGIEPGNTVTCPECGKRRHESKWVEADIWCEYCGSHPGIACPECHEKFDACYDTDKFIGKIRKTQPKS